MIRNLIIKEISRRKVKVSDLSILTDLNSKTISRYLNNVTDMKGENIETLAKALDKEIILIDKR